MPHPPLTKHDASETLSPSTKLIFYVLQMKRALCAVYYKVIIELKPKIQGTIWQVTQSSQI